MKLYHRIAALALAILLLLGCAYADGLDARWTLGNIVITADENEFAIGPDAQLEILQDEGEAKLHFGLNLNQRELLPVTAELSGEGIFFSLGSRVYSLDVDALIDELGLTDEEKNMISHLDEAVQHASALMASDTSTFMRGNDEIINRIYEILVGKNAEETEVTVGEIQLPARKYAGEIKLVHVVDLLNYIRNCPDENLALFGDSLLKIMNLAANREYISFSSHYYDGFFGDPNNDEPLADVEILLGYNDDLFYQKITYSGEDIATTTSEFISTEENTVMKMTEGYSAEDENYSSCTSLEMDGPAAAPTAIRMNMELDDSYTEKNDAAGLTLTVREVTQLSFDAAAQDGLWSAGLTGSLDSAAAYDYGTGPVVVNEEFDMTGSYAEARGEDGRITGDVLLEIALDDHSASLQFEIGRGEGAQIASLLGENTQTYTLDADTDGVGYKLLSADLMAMAASAAELYADPGVYSLMRFANADGPDWPEDLSDDIYNRYASSYYEQWQRVYRFADAARIFAGNMPRYSQPENSVLSGIDASAHNLQLNYLSNDGDFWIDITYLSDSDPIPTNAVAVSVDDFTFLEEDDMLIAYYCDGEYLVFFHFEKPDRARAEEIISGLMLASKKVGLST